MLQSPESKGAWSETAFSLEGSGATLLSLILVTIRCGLGWDPGA